MRCLQGDNLKYPLQVHMPRCSGNTWLAGVEWAANLGKTIQRRLSSFQENTKTVKAEKVIKVSLVRGLASSMLLFIQIM